MELLGGGGEGPPENSTGLPSKGNAGIRKLLELKTTDPSKYKSICREISTKSINYKDRYEGGEGEGEVEEREARESDEEQKLKYDRSRAYNPEVFDLEETRREIKAAIESPASTPNRKTLQSSFFESRIRGKYPDLPPPPFFYIPPSPHSMY